MLLYGQRRDQPCRPAKAQEQECGRGQQDQCSGVGRQLKGAPWHERSKPVGSGVAAQRGDSASAARIRAHERMPLWKLCRSYFSFGEWMLSSSRPKPTSTVSRPSVRLKSATIGIEAPEPIRTVSLPHSSVNARLAAASGFMFQSSAMAGALEWSPNSAVQSFGSRAET